MGKRRRRISCKTKTAPTLPPCRRRNHVRVSTREREIPQETCKILDWFLPPSHPLRSSLATPSVLKSLDPPARTGEIDRINVAEHGPKIGAPQTLAPKPIPSSLRTIVEFKGGESDRHAHIYPAFEMSELTSIVGCFIDSCSQSRSNGAVSGELTPDELSTFGLR